MKTYSYIWAWAFAAVFMLGFAAAHAAPVTVTATVSATMPTTRTDGTALSAAQIKHMTLRWGTVSGTYTNSVTILPSALPYDWSQTLDIPVGSTRTVFYVATVTDVDGRESAASAEAKKQFSLISDANPTSPSITVSGWACSAAAGFKCVVLP